MSLLCTNNYFYQHEAVYGDGLSTYDVHDKLHLKHPKIFEELCWRVLNIVGRDYKFLDMWANVYHHGSYVKPHSHFDKRYPEGLCGVYYLKKPNDSGNLIINNQLIVIDENDLVIFGNKDIHSTEKNKSNESRIVISFNLIK